MIIENLLPNKNIPKKIFLTGVPGSRWSGIAQEIEEFVDADCSDRTSEREYSHSKFSGHKGAYFGTGMEFSSELTQDNLDAPYSTASQNKCRVYKSHEWSYMLDTIDGLFKDKWIIMVYRNDTCSFDWWGQAGGWNITYPNYSWYKNHYNMKQQIQKQNNAILRFAAKKQLPWYQHTKFNDVFVSVYTGPNNF